MFTNEIRPYKSHTDHRCQSCDALHVALMSILDVEPGRLHGLEHFMESDYETIGGLFREISKETIQLSVAQQKWGILQELVTAIATTFGLLYEEVYDVVINHSEEMAHIGEFYNLKSASCTCET